MSINNTWKTVSNNNKSKNEFNECSLSFLVSNNKVCYYCLINRCKNDKHDRYEQNLKRLRYSFKDILYNPLNYSTKFKNIFTKQTSDYMRKKHNIKHKNFYITTCTSQFLGKRCYNVSDGNHFEINFEGQTFTVCHKNPKGTMGKITICLHCDLEKKNKNVKLVPFKIIEKIKDKPKEVKKEETKTVSIPEVKEEVKKVVKDPNHWSNSLFKSEDKKKEEKKKEEKPDFEVKIKKEKKSKDNNQWAKSLIDQKIQNEIDEKNLLINKLKDENLKMKEFITDAYDMSISDILNNPIKEEPKLEEICLVRYRRNNSLIKLWKKAFNKQIAVN